MPFLRAAEISRELQAIREDAKGVRNQERQDAIEKAVQEMEHMNSLLTKLELALAGF
ncbi:MAG: hypothetical protein IJS28_06890 [Synergistaceae bacterium]|nr:hypothetical protein [Synergistaceae bacterium]